MSRTLGWRASITAFVATSLLFGAATFATPAGASVQSVALSANVNPAVVGQRIAFKMKVIDSSVPAATITGAATFTDGATPLATVPVVNAVATYATTRLPAGTHSVTASFAPADGSVPTVSNSLVEVVNAADTTTTVTSSRPVATYGNPGNIVATVKAVAPGAGVATGTVDFYVDGDLYWNAALDTRGKAMWSLPDMYAGLYPGSYTITATYSGDANYNSSTAAGVTQTITGSLTVPTTTLTLNAKGLPVFSVRSFTMSSLSPVGCDVTITNATPSAQALVYGTPGSWKRLPFGTIPAGGSLGVGVSIDHYTGYFATMANPSNYISIHCI